MKTICLALGYILWLINAYSQPGSKVYPPEKIKNEKVIVETMDGIKYTGQLIDCTEYILEIQLWNTTDSALSSHYYFKVSDYIYRVLIKHVKTVAISKGKGIGFAKGAGAISGGITFGSIGYHIVNTGEEYDETFRAITAVGVGFAAVVVIGASIGFIKGLFTRNKININGNSSNTDKRKKFF